jgi:hypothetical protein
MFLILVSGLAEGIDLGSTFSVINSLTNVHQRVTTVLDFET